MPSPITEETVSAWVEGYVQAWRSTRRADIEAIFAPDAESYEWPYKTAWIGIEEIISGWSARESWQAGGWTFTWRLLVINGDTFAVQGVGVYDELGDFDNLWVVTLDGDGRCSTLRMWNNQI